MKPVALAREDAAVAALEGRVICGDVRGADGKVTVEKGQVLDAELARRLLDLPWRVLHLLELEPGDIHEEPAGARLSQAAAGEGVEVKGYSGGAGEPERTPLNPRPHHKSHCRLFFEKKKKNHIDDDHEI